LEISSTFPGGILSYRIPPSIAVLLSAALFKSSYALMNKIRNSNGVPPAQLVGGIQFVSMGLLGEIMARTYYESQNKPIYALREVKSHRKEMGDPAEPARPSGNTER